MKKIDDWFVAGLVAGAIGGAVHLIWNTLFLLLGVNYKTFWQAMSGIFYNKQLSQTLLAQVHGALDAIGLSAMNGVLLSLILLITGKDYLYLKSVALSASSAYFLFIIVFPGANLGKNSLILPWISFGGFIFGNGLLTGYILDKIGSFNKEPKNENASDSSKKLRRFFLLPEPAKKKINKVRFVKPKK